MPFDLPPEIPPAETVQVTAQCVQAAAQHYHVPPSLILAILTTEGGQPGLASKNKNGTFDLGPMQVNTIWVKREGLSAADLRDNGCYNVHVGTAILAREILSAGEVATGIGNYHSRTPRFHDRYRKKVQQSWRSIKAKISSLRQQP